MNPLTSAERARFATGPVAGRLPAPTLDALLDAATAIELPRGRVLFAHGDPAEHFFFVRSGGLEVIAGPPEGDAVVAHLGPGDCFGEAGLATSGGRRAASVRAVVRTRLLRVERAEFDRLAAARVFAGAARPTSTLSRHLHVLAGLVEAEADAGERRRFAPGEVVVRQGERGEAAYFVLDGYAQVFDDAVEPRGLLGSLGPGQCFGELALLEDAPRAATVEASAPLLVLEVPRARFLRWHARHPPLRELLASMRSAYASPGRGSTTIFAGRLDGAPCVTSITRTPDGRALVSSKRLDRPELVLSREHAPEDDVELLHFERAAGADRRVLELAAGRPVGATLVGDLSVATGFAERLWSDAPLSDKERARFLWTGSTGRPTPGRDRLVCGCVGLTRGQIGALLDEGLGHPDVVARTGATSVCGGCERGLRQATSGVALELSDEVTAQALELHLERVPFCPDPAHGLHGPDSVSWKLLRESSAILGGGAAILMQVAHPLVAEGLSAHSSIAEDPGGRFERTMSSMYRMTFGTRDQVLEMAREVHEKHERVAGRFGRACGRHPAGAGYSANQLEGLLWVAMTLTWTAVRVHEDLWGPLTSEEKARLMNEIRAQYTLFGIPASMVPDTWNGFLASFNRFVSSDRIAVGEHGRALAAVGLESPRALTGPAYALSRPLTVRWLPAPLRRAFDLRYGPVERAAAQASLRVLRRALPTLPEGVRFAPPYLNALRRLRGEPTPHPVGQVMKRLSIFLAGGPLRS